MAAQVFIVFPDIIDSDEIDDFKRIILLVSSIQSNLKKDMDVTLFYDTKNLESFIDSAKELIAQKVDRITQRLRTLLGKTSLSWRSVATVDKGTIYCLWNFEKWKLYTPINDTYCEVAERNIQNKDVDYLAITLAECDCFNEEKKETIIERDFLPILVDAPHREELPQLFKIDRIRTYGEFQLWLKLLKGDVEFKLKGNSNFERTNLTYIKQRIYQHNESKQYWYFDFFHKDNKIHYEVFNEIGKHLGEADEDGKLNKTKVDKSKSINKIISGKG